MQWTGLQGMGSGGAQQMALKRSGAHRIGRPAKERLQSKAQAWSEGKWAGSAAGETDGLIRMGLKRTVQKRQHDSAVDRRGLQI
jgi:hypothetical protein